MKTWLALSFCCLMLIINPVYVFGESPDTDSAQLNFKVFLPSISQAENNVISQENHRFFGWKLAETEVTAASLDSLNDFGREWIQRYVDNCKTIDQQEENSLAKEDCSMLRYALAGKFTPEDLKKIKANNGYIIQVAEGSIPVEIDESKISSAALKQGIANHWITGETLSATVEGVFWDAKFRHKTWAGVYASGYSQYIVEMRGYATGSIQYNISWPTRYWTDYYPEQSGAYVGWGKTGYSVYTEVCFTASNSVQQARICANSGPLNY